ncbi:MAG: hypothetical protein IJC49_01110 [Clostridia bacterium]|nr:hypothetical protein [Clostridia bacterium]
MLKAGGAKKVCLGKGFYGGCICAFGVGILLTSFLPCGVLVVVQGVAVVAAGALVLCR